MPEVLVSVPHADGEAAIVRDVRGVWLAGRAREPSVMIDDHRPAVEGLEGDRTAHGGRLPPGAAGAEVVDDAERRHAAAAGNGFWVVVLDQPLGGGAAPVRYVDAAGETVAAPLPAGPRTPVPDAPEPCPACGATGWDELVPDDPSGREPLVVCCTCGHAETSVSYSPLRAGEAPPWPEEENLPEGEPPLPPLPDFAERGHWMLAEAGFPIYAVPGRPAEVGGSGRHGDVLDRIEIVHAGPPEVTVTTKRERDAFGGEAWLARRALRDLGDEFGTLPDRSQPAIAVWFSARERESRRVAATAVLTEGELTLEGAPARFAIATGDLGWAAVRRHGDLLITVAARGCAPAEIELDPLVT
ncbi:MAG TPA: hypothetical protein VH418_19190 [Solirubrobacteraceae bacterium]